MKKSSVILRWAVITGIVASLYSYLMYASNLAFTNKSLSYVSFLIMFGGMVMAMIQFRDKVNGGYATFGEQYTVGILMVLIMAVITTVYFMIFLQLTPDFVTKSMDQAQADMVNKGMSSDQIEMAMKYSKMFMSPAIMAIFGLLGNGIVGAILGLLAAAITSKAKPFMEEENNITPQV